MVRTRVRFGSTQTRVKNTLEDVSGNEGFMDLPLTAEVEGLSRGPDGVPTVYTEKRIAEDASLPQTTVRNYVNFGKITPRQLVTYGGGTILRVIPAKPAEEVIERRKLGTSLSSEGGVVSESFLGKYLDIPVERIWAVAERNKLPCQKVGGRRFYEKDEADWLIKYYMLQKAISEGYISPEELARRVGVNSRTVYNWLERDFKFDETAGKELPSFMPAVKVSAGGPRRYLIHKEAADTPEKASEFRRRAKWEFKRKGLPPDRREWSFCGEISEKLREHEQTVVRYALTKGYGERHGNNTIVSPEQSDAICRHYVGRRFARENCLSMAAFGGMLGFNGYTFREWVERYAEKDELGPVSLFRIPFFRFEGGLYIPRESEEAGYTTKTPQGRAALNKRIQECVDEQVVSAWGPPSKDRQAALNELLDEYGSIEALNASRTGLRRLRWLGFKVNVIPPIQGSIMRPTYRIEPIRSNLKNDRL